MRRKKGHARERMMERITISMKRAGVQYALYEYIPYTKVWKNRGLCRWGHVSLSTGGVVGCPKIRIKK
jgi:hypothetical protein